MRLVVDASVALKWLFRWRDDEPDVDAALAILRAVFDGRATLLQPPHFLAEVSAVLASKAGKWAEASLSDLLAIEMEIVSSPGALTCAIDLSQRLSHHLFDTLYHAVALQEDALLVTADERYHRVARGEGRIVRLCDFSA